MNIGNIHASCGVPTEIYHKGIEANHSVKDWKYFAVLADGKLIISYGYKWDFIAPSKVPSKEVVFMKSERFMSAFKYSKDN